MLLWSFFKHPHQHKDINSNAQLQQDMEDENSSSYYALEDNSTDYIKAHLERYNINVISKAADGRSPFLDD